MSNATDAKGTVTTTYAHYTVRARMGRYPFADEELARWVWRRLEEGFPDALAAILMPNHLQLIAPDGGDAALRKLRGIVGASGRASHQIEWDEAMWQRIEPPTSLDSPDKVRRSVRYVWLNCCRPWRYQGRWTRLVDDPLRWRWSTLHDAIGAIVEPWIPGERVARVFGWSTGATMAEQIHRYAAHDEHVSQEAAAFPVLPAPSFAPDRAIDDVLDAALAATRSPREALHQRTTARAVAVGLAYRQGWRQAKALSPVFGVHATTVSKIAKRARRDWLEVAALCLDPRIARGATLLVPAA